MNFQTIPATATVRSFTPAEQAAAWDAYISQDSYLSAAPRRVRGRAAVLLPMVWRLDFNIAQDLFKNLGGRRHALTFAADFLNFANLLNHDWGVGQRVFGQRPTSRSRTRRRRAGRGPLPDARRERRAA